MAHPDAPFRQELRDALLALDPLFDSDVATGFAVGAQGQAQGPAKGQAQGISMSAGKRLCLGADKGPDQPSQWQKKQQEVLR